MTVDKEYQIKRLEIGDRGKFLECFNEGIASCSKDHSDFDWQYVNNPAGSVRGYGAFSDEKLVAIYVVSPVRFKIGNEIVLGAQSMDTLTLPCAQKKGLFKTLGLQTYQDITHEGLIKFTYGFPNKNSKHGFMKYLNWVLSDPCCFLVNILNTSCIAKKAKLPFKFSLPLPIFPVWKSKYHVAQVEKLPSGLDTLWQSFKQTFDIGVVRDEIYLRWRFEAKPKTKYNYFEARTQKEELEGIGIMRIMDKPEGRIAYLMELMTNKGNKKSLAELLYFMMKKARSEKAEMVAIRLSKYHPFYRFFLKKGFISLPDWLYPNKVYPGYVAHDSQFRSVLDNQRGWYFSYADDDTM